MTEKLPCNFLVKNGLEWGCQMPVSCSIDWGTGLDQSLYIEAIVHELGGTDTVTQQLPMRINGVSLGNQRFHLIEDKMAFRITTFQHPNIDHYETSLRKLLGPSPLSSIHWVNISRHEILLKSIIR